MKIIWLRPKNWLIKKLGGFTETEYMFRPCRFIERRNGQVEMISAEGRYSLFLKPPEDFIEERLIYQLAQGLKPYAQWQRAEDRERGEIKIRATIKVVRDDG